MRFWSIRYSALALTLLFAGLGSGVHAEERSITFPVIGSVRFSDDFAAPRSGGRTHEGNDLLGVKMLPLVAAVDGFVRYVTWPQQAWGYLVSLRDAEDYEYDYLHINNDTPGTDDGLGGGRFAYAPGIEDGAPVVRGQLIGWMGDSGNAEGTTPHLHFETRRPDGTAFSPYASLLAASRITQLSIAPQLPGELLPFGEFTGGATVAVGNVDPTHDGLETVVAAGPGGGPHVRIFDTEGNLLSQFFALPTFVRTGLDITTGDFDGDGTEEIAVAPGAGSGPVIRTFNGHGELLGQFFAYHPAFRGGVRIDAADLDGDGKAELMTGTGRGEPSLVKVFTAQGALLTEIRPYGTSFVGGVDVAGVAGTDDSSAQVLTAPGPGGGPLIRQFRPDGTPLGQFFAYAETFRGGARIDAANIDQDSVTPEIVTVPAASGSGHVRLFSFRGTVLPDDLHVFEEWWTGGFEVGAGTGAIFAASGPGGRRASVREVERNTRFFSKGAEAALQHAIP